MSVVNGNFKSNNLYGMCLSFNKESPKMQTLEQMKNHMVDQDFSEKAFACVASAVAITILAAAILAFSSELIGLGIVFFAGHMVSAFKIAGHYTEKYIEETGDVYFESMFSKVILLSFLGGSSIIPLCMAYTRQRRIEQSFNEAKKKIEDLKQKWNPDIIREFRQDRANLSACYNGVSLAENGLVRQGVVELERRFAWLDSAISQVERGLQQSSK
ncbi:MAG: hypothetical protein Q8L98_06930 [Chlamydiales bacterium]|nr:hypothetical protein [Chlamydiales bacterium]